MTDTIPAAATGLPTAAHHVNSLPAPTESAAQFESAFMRAAEAFKAIYIAPDNDGDETWTLDIARAQTRLLSTQLADNRDAGMLVELIKDEALTDAGDRIAYTKLIRFLQDPAPLASPLSLATVADQPMSEHPDAALLDAWASFKMGHEDLAAIGGDADEIYDRIDAARLVLDSTQAKTIQGAAVRLSYVFADRYEWLTAFHAMFYGTDIPAEHLPDERDVVFFDVTKNVRALALV